MRLFGASKVVLLALLLTVVLSTSLGQESASISSGVDDAIAIEVWTDEGFRPLDYSIVGTVVPTIRIRGDLPEDYRVFNDRPDGRAGIGGGPSGLGKEVTGLFRQTPDGGLEAQIAMLHGVNEILVVFDDGNLSVVAHASMLNYSTDFEDVNGNGELDVDEDTNGNGLLDTEEDANGNELLDVAEDTNGNLRLDVDEDLNGNGVLDPGEDFNGDGAIGPIARGLLHPLADDDEDFVGDPASGFLMHKELILLAFVDEASDVEISYFLCANGLNPVGVSFDFLNPIHPDIVTAKVPAGALAIDLVNSLNGVSLGEHFMPSADRIPVDPPFEVALPLLLAPVGEVSGESLPERLTNGETPPPSAGNVGDVYDPARGGFDNDGDAHDELDIAWPHFFYDTYAAHRLVDKLLEKIHSPSRPGVAVDGTGLGDGNPANLAILRQDVPDDRLFDPRDCVGAAGAVGCNPVGLAGVADTEVPLGHETTATLLAAGAGNRILGTGKDVAVKPVRRRTWAQVNEGYLHLARDPRVRVINMSYGLSDFDRYAGPGPDGNSGFGPNGRDDAPSGPGGGDDAVAIPGPGNDPWDDNPANLNGHLDPAEENWANATIRATHRTIINGIRALQYRPARDVNRDDDGDGRVDEDPPGDQSFFFDVSPSADGCPGVRGDDDGDGRRDFSDAEVMAGDYDADGTTLAGPDGDSGAGPDGDFGFGPNAVDDAPEGPGGGDDAAAVAGPGNDPWDDNGRPGPGPDGDFGFGANGRDDAPVGPGGGDDAPAKPGPNNDPWDDNTPSPLADNDTDDIVLARNDDDEDGRIDEDPLNNGNKIVVLSAGNSGKAPNYDYDTRYSLPAPFNPGADGDSGYGVNGIDDLPLGAGGGDDAAAVPGAGNDPWDDNVPPLFDVPVRGARPTGGGGPDSRLFMVASATGIQGAPTGPERSWQSTSVGNQVSVSAAGSDEMVVVRRDMQFRATTGGTSWAAPQVAGLAGEILYLSDNSPRVSVSPIQVVELIEATADDLGTETPWVAPLLNSQPGDGDDDRFGYGRINCWKAMLSTVNGGVAAESHKDANQFRSLARIGEADTEWYGFKIITSVRHATVWLNGQQLKDAGASVPNSPEITAYKGVLSNQAILIGVDDDHDSAPPNDIRLDEDPTSGVVPVGNGGGEYVITFSIERGDLLGPGGQGRTLSLRLPTQSAAHAPFFNLQLDRNELQRMRNGLVPGVVFDDFVFEITPTDHGDAPPGYPVSYPVTYVPEAGGGRPALNGACHLNTNLEWFGKPNRANVQSVSPEKDAISVVDPDGFYNIDRGADLDRFDDGVVFYPLTYLPGQTNGKVVFTVCVADRGSGRYANDPDRSLYVNGWIDWNTNNKWEEANNEHIVNGLRIDPANWPARVGSATLTETSPNSASYTALFPVPSVIGEGELWARFRLDYGENVGRNDPRPLFRSDPSLRDPALPQTASQAAGAGRGYVEGAARFGEVEDYRIGSDFGDAPDKGAGKYPTRMSPPSDGARHLDIYKEWLDGDKTREPDACLPASAVSSDEDIYRGAPPNIGIREANCPLENQDLAEEAFVFFDGENGLLYVTFTVHSEIYPRGYDLMGIDDDGDGLIDEDPYDDGVDEDGDGKDGEDEPDEMPVFSMDPAGCGALKEFQVLSTPPWSGGKGRYYATEIDDDRDGTYNEDPIDGADNDSVKDRLIDEDPLGIKPLFANIFVDWNGDRDWRDAGEWVLVNGLIAPETFGTDTKYTLGEPFRDLNHDGVWQPGEPFQDSAGTPEETYECVFFAPESVAEQFWVRIRLTYAELSNGTVPITFPLLSLAPSIVPLPALPATIIPGVSSETLVQAGVAHATEDRRQLDREKGGALFGEVEDYPVVKPTITKIPNLTVIPAGETFTYTISLGNPSEFPLEGVLITDPLPRELSFGSFLETPSGITFSSKENAVVGELTLGPEAETHITYTVEVPREVPPYTPIFNCVTVEGPGFIDRLCTPKVTVTEHEPEPLPETYRVSFTITPGVLSFVTIPLPTPILDGMLSAGVTGLSIRSGELPPGLELDEASWSITGVAINPGFLLPFIESMSFAAVFAGANESGDTVATLVVDVTVRKPEGTGFPFWPGPSGETDSDGDGVPDSDDACTETPGCIDNSGCPCFETLADTDCDGTADAYDGCVGVPGPPENGGCPFEG